MRILIAEDDFTSRRMMKYMMAEYGDVDIAINGEEAFELFKIAQDEGIQYDLVCLDIMMPEVDGIEALRRIRSYEAMIGLEGDKTAKIIMITALDDFDNISTAFKNQCEGYLVKPIELKKLEELLRKIELL